LQAVGWRIGSRLRGELAPHRISRALSGFGEAAQPLDVGQAGGRLELEALYRLRELRQARIAYRKLRREVPLGDARVVFRPAR
jgi:hypothetical protein